jgi:hypothetical protein
MDDELRSALRNAGWRAGTRRGFYATSRAGIEFEVGDERGGGRILLLYRYHGSGGTNAEGEVALPADAPLARVEDAMTHVYQRVHERPDPSRVFGRANKGTSRPAAPPPPRVTPPLADPPPTQTPEEAGQGALEL